MAYNNERIRHAYKSKCNLKLENQKTFLMITDGEKLHYLTVNKFFALCREIAYSNYGDFFCKNFFHSFRTKTYVKHLCETHDYCYTEVPKEDNKILKYNHGKNLRKFYLSFKLI